MNRLFTTSGVRSGAFRLSARLVAIMCSGVLAFVVVPSAEAKPDQREDPSRGVCTLGSLNATYAFTGIGTIVNEGPVASVGTITFYGDGNLSNAFTQSRNGTVVQLAFTGVYTVNADCTGSASLSAGQTLDFVILARGDELMWIRTNPGLVVTAIAKKQFRHNDE
jgi:hypothetical protein